MVTHKNETMMFDSLLQRCISSFSVAFFDADRTCSCSLLLFNTNKMVYEAFAALKLRSSRAPGAKVALLPSFLFTILPHFSFDPSLSLSVSLILPLIVSEMKGPLSASLRLFNRI